LRIETVEHFQHKDNFFGCGACKTKVNHKPRHHPNSQQRIGSHRSWQHRHWSLPRTRRRKLFQKVSHPYQLPVINRRIGKLKLKECEHNIKIKPETTEFAIQANQRQ
jgi:hypothetical protein